MTVPYHALIATRNYHEAVYNMIYPVDFTELVMVAKVDISLVNFYARQFVLHHLQNLSPNLFL